MLHEMALKILKRVLPSRLRLPFSLSYFISHVVGDMLWTWLLHRHAAIALSPCSNESDLWTRKESAAASHDAPAARLWQSFLPSLFWILLSFQHQKGPVIMQKRGAVSTSPTWGPEKTLQKKNGSHPRPSMEAIMFSCFAWNFSGFMSQDEHNASFISDKICFP